MKAGMSFKGTDALFGNIYLAKKEKGDNYLK